MMLHRNPSVLVSPNSRCGGLKAPLTKITEYGVDGVDDAGFDVRENPSVSTAPFADPFRPRAENRTNFRFIDQEM